MSQLREMKNMAPTVRKMSHCVVWLVHLWSLMDHVLDNALLSADKVMVRGSPSSCWWRVHPLGLQGRPVVCPLSQHLP